VKPATPAVAHPGAVVASTQIGERIPRLARQGLDLVLTQHAVIVVRSPDAPPKTAPHAGALAVSAFVAFPVQMWSPPVIEPSIWSKNGV
jgi:hypothetical protein